MKGHPGFMTKFSVACVACILEYCIVYRYASYVYVYEYSPGPDGPAMVYSIHSPDMDNKNIFVRFTYELCRIICIKTNGHFLYVLRSHFYFTLH